MGCSWSILFQFVSYSPSPLGVALMSPWCLHLWVVRWGRYGTTLLRGSKKFLFSVREDKAELRLEERGKGFVGYVFVGFQCFPWLVTMVEEVMKSLGKEDVKFDRGLLVCGGTNKAGQYLEVAVYAEGGPKGIMWLPGGC